MLIMMLSAVKPSQCLLGVMLVYVGWTFGPCWRNDFRLKFQPSASLILEFLHAPFGETLLLVLTEVYVLWDLFWVAQGARFLWEWTPCILSRVQRVTGSHAFQTVVAMAFYAVASLGCGICASLISFWTATTVRAQYHYGGISSPDSNSAWMIHSANSSVPNLCFWCRQMATGAADCFCDVFVKCRLTLEGDPCFLDWGIMLEAHGLRQSLPSESSILIISGAPKTFSKSP